MINGGCALCGAVGISQYRLAKEIGVSARRINEIVKGVRAITADTDLRLARFFGLSDGYWPPPDTPGFSHAWSEALPSA